MASEELGISCPKCGHPTSVKDSRPAPGNAIRRRRVCVAAGCGERFSTYEIAAISTPEGLMKARFSKETTARLKRLSEDLAALVGDAERADDMIDAVAQHSKVRT